MRLATGAGIHYLIVREDEPFTNPAYLAGRLVQMGLRVPPPLGGCGLALFVYGDSIPLELEHV